MSHHDSLAITEPSGHVIAMTSRLEDTPSLAPLKAMIWLYFVLLLTEGALRKWFLPGFSDLLFVVRDPVVIIIYGLALQARVFPLRIAIVSLGVIAFFSALFSALGDAPPAVTLFGLRTNYLHLPLVFIMMQTLDRSDAIRFGRMMLIAAIPIFAIMLVQFQSSPDAWINAGAGGSDNGQIHGALGKIRPPGPFSFIDGVVSFFSLTTAFIYYGWIKQRVFGRLLLLLSTIVTVLAVPISISRSLLMGVLIVLGFGLATSLKDMRTFSRFFPPLIIAGLCLLLVSETVYMKAFATRWDESMNAGHGTFYSNVVERIVGNYTESIGLLDEAPLLGHGIGMGTLGGAHLMTGKATFLLAESELSRIVLELGPILGAAFICWRLWLALNLVFGGWRHRTLTHDSLSWLIAGATCLGVISGQWGSSTQLGFSVFGAGLAMAARNEPTPQTIENKETEEEEPIPA